MIDTLTDQPAVFFLVLTLVLSLVALFGSYALAARYAPQRDGRDENAFGLGQTAIFGLIVLILAFSFSFAAERFEARRALVVEEADGVAAAYDHMDYLPPARRDIERDLVRRYTGARIRALGDVSYTWEDSPNAQAANGYYRRLWDMATADVRADRRDVAYLTLAEEIDKAGDIAEYQVAAVNNHIPPPILGIVILCTLVGAALLGLTFGRVRSPNRALSVIFCVLFAATVFTIVDMDHPKGGLLQIDVAPLQNAFHDMRP